MPSGRERANKKPEPEGIAADEDAYKDDSRRKTWDYNYLKKKKIQLCLDGWVAGSV